MSAPLRWIYRQIRRLDRADPAFLRWIPGRFKRTLVRRFFRAFRDPLARRPLELEGGGVLHVPPGLQHTFVLQEHEPGSRKLVRRLLEPGMTFVDVGANVGLYTVVAGRRVGPEGRVVAVEADAGNRGWLARNVRANGLPNVEILPFAAGAEHRRRRFQLRRDGGHHGFYGHPVEETVEEIEVEERPLDELVEGPVELVKLDVEGGELEALRGMERILAHNPRIRVLLEWSPPLLQAAGLEVEATPRWLAGRGFELLRVDEEGEGREEDLEPVEPERLAELDWSGDHNLLARRPSGSS